MPYNPHYLTHPPTRAEVDALPGPVLLEFGAPWCAHCQAAQALIETVLQEHPEVEHLKIEDGRGQPLGRSFGVKLWPTLIYLRAGTELARVVRPHDAQALRATLQS